MSSVVVVVDRPQARGRRRNGLRSRTDVSIDFAAGKISDLRNDDDDDGPAMTSSSAAAILLLKDPPESVETDPYGRAFVSKGYDPYWVAPLSTVPTNEDELERIVSDGAEGRWSGVVVTSKRAVVAWKAAVEKLQREAKGKRKAADVVGTGWDRIPFFAVGPATAEALSTTAGPSASRILGAEESGTGSSLGRFIVSHFSRDPPPLPLLFLTGDKRSPAIPDALSSASPPIPFVEHQVYATAPSSKVEEDSTDLLDTFASKGTVLRWVVLFSPSGGTAALPILRRRGLLKVDGKGDLRIAVIGPTTETWLEEQEGIRPDAVSAKPEATALVEALVAADGA